MTAVLAGVTVAPMTEAPKPKRVRNHKSSGTQWTAARHREAGHDKIGGWIDGGLKARVDALRKSRGQTFEQVLEAAITLLEEKSS